MLQTSKTCQDSFINSPCKCYQTPSITCHITNRLRGTREVFRCTGVGRHCPGDLCGQACYAYTEIESIPYHLNADYQYRVCMILRHVVRTCAEPSLSNLVSAGEGACQTYHLGAKTLSYIDNNAIFSTIFCLSAPSSRTQSSIKLQTELH